MINSLYLFHDITSISGTLLEYAIAGVICLVLALWIWRKPYPYFP